MKKQQREHDAGWLAGRNTSFNAQLGTGTQYPHRDKNSVKTNHRNNSNDLMLHEDLREQLRSALE